MPYDFEKSLKNLLFGQAYTPNAMPDLNQEDRSLLEVYLLQKLMEPPYQLPPELGEEGMAKARKKDVLGNIFSGVGEGISAIAERRMPKPTESSFANEARIQADRKSALDTYMRGQGHDALTAQTLGGLEQLRMRQQAATEAKEAAELERQLKRKEREEEYAHELYKERYRKELDEAIKMREQERTALGKATTEIPSPYGRRFPQAGSEEHEAQKTQQPTIQDILPTAPTMPRATPYTPQAPGMPRSTPDSYQVPGMAPSHGAMPPEAMEQMRQSGLRRGQQLGSTMGISAPGPEMQTIPGEDLTPYTEENLGMDLENPPQYRIEMPEMDLRHTSPPWDVKSYPNDPLVPYGTQQRDLWIPPEGVPKDRPVVEPQMGGGGGRFGGGLLPSLLETALPPSAVPQPEVNPYAPPEKTRSGQQPIGPGGLPVGTSVTEMGEKMAAIQPIAGNITTLSNILTWAEQTRGGDVPGAGWWQAFGDAAPGLLGGGGGIIGGIAGGPIGSVGGSAAGAAAGYGVKKLSRSVPDPGDEGRQVQAVTDAISLYMAKILQGARASDLDLQTAKAGYGLDIATVDFEQRIRARLPALISDVRTELMRLKATSPETYDYFRQRGLWGLEEFDAAIGKIEVPDHWRGAGGIPNGQQTLPSH